MIPRVLAVLLVAASPLAAQAPVELAPGFLLYGTPAGNVVAAIGTAGAFVLGPVAVANTQQIQADLASRTHVAPRYVVMTEQPLAQSQGDAGWQKLGAFVAAHEAMTARLRIEAARLSSIGAEIPRIAFSEVLKFSLGGQEIHAVRQPPGHSASDVLVHFENVGIVYLGESLPGDGYPLIDITQEASIDSLIATINPWAGRGRNRFIAARGAPETSAEVTAYRDMLVSVRDRVKAAKQQGRTEDQVVASHPAAAFDQQYGHGRVTADDFVKTVFRTVH
jgi:cyclase